MSAQHTRGRMQQGAKYPQDITTPDGHYTIARTLPQPSAAVAEANARRIAACWNVLEGVPTEMIELASEAGKGHPNYGELKAQRDELLEALLRIADTKPQHGMNPNAFMSDPDEIKVGWNVHWIARAAIYKAEGAEDGK